MTGKEEVNNNSNITDEEFVDADHNETVPNAGNSTIVVNGTEEKQNTEDFVEMEIEIEPKMTEDVNESFKIFVFVGIILGIAVLLCLVGLIFVCRKKRNRKKT